MTTPDDQLRDRLREATRFADLVHVRDCSSTQDLATEQPQDAATVFWADHQTAGRGRQRRPWDDAPGLDLLVTFLLRLRLPNPVALPAVVPLCVSRAVTATTRRHGVDLGPRLRLKWPNDVLLDERKLAGVLIDAGNTRPGTYAIGIGINVNRTHLPRELEPIGTSLALATGHEHDRHDLLFDLAVELDRLATQLERNDPHDIDGLAADYAANLALIGRDVVIDTGAARVARLTAVDLRELTFADGTKVPLGQVRALRRR